MQKQKIYIRGEEIFISNEYDVVYDEIKWGKVEKLFTPAFWYSQNLFLEAKNDIIFNYRIGSSFKQEVVACLLGGYGIPSEIGNAKFNQFVGFGFFEKENFSENEISKILHTPIDFKGNKIKYRFASQKSKYIYDALEKISNIDEKKLSDLELRKFLITINGIGLKTASWIIRNHRQSNEVAILDIHIYRAGILAGFFNLTDKVEKNYMEMEKKFLRFCKELKIEASRLDGVIWRIMKTLNDIAIDQFYKTIVFK